MKIFLIIFSVFCCLLDLKPNTSESFLFKSTGDSNTAISASFSFENLNLFYSNSFSFTKKIEKKNITQITDESDGIFELEDFGYLFRFEKTEWTFNIDWGWMYLFQNTENADSLWFFNQNKGWHWTSFGVDGTYPYIFSNKIGYWLKRKDEEGSILIYSFQNNKWITLDEYLD